MWAVSAGICPIGSLLLLFFAPPSPGTNPQWFGLFVGTGAARVRKIFRRARLYAQAHGVCILFIEYNSLRVAFEADARPGIKVPVVTGGSLMLNQWNHIAVTWTENDQILDRASSIRITGLMTVPPPTPTPEGARRYFASLRQLRDGLLGGWPDLLELSMGMSGDYSVAVEEGATMVRVGTALFGPRPTAG